jgi:hypothetical protein
MQVAQAADNNTHLYAETDYYNSSDSPGLHRAFVVPLFFGLTYAS